MATSRGERMQERMRGAGRHEVADESFGLFLPVQETPKVPTPDPAPQPSSEPAPAPVVATRSTPNTSAKRRQLNSESGSSRQRTVSTRSKTSVQTSSASKSDPYDLQRSPEEGEDGEDILQAGPEAALRPSPRASTMSRISNPPLITEEVTESPVGAPGSGRRRRVRISDVTAQSAQLHKALMMDDDAGFTGEMTTSSPLARKTRKSAATPSALSAGSKRASARSVSIKGVLDADELTPIARPTRKSNSTIASSSARSSSSAGRRSTLSAVANEPDELSSPVPLVDSRRRAQAKLKNARGRGPVPAVDDLEQVEKEPPAGETDEAEEIDVNEAASRIGSKRSRPSPPREESPELDSQVVEASRPTKKRRRERIQASPAKQSQPRGPRSKKAEAKHSRRRESGNGGHIDISVQRYTKRQRSNEDDTDVNIPNGEILFANHSGVNVVDVLSQMCDEVIESNLATLHAAAAQAQDSATKKEYRTKLRALEAFQAELHTRLLEHTIALDTMHALKKRVRSAQKEKLSLRSEIMRIRAEREQVALKMDAVRIQHETETKEISHQLGLSSTMHDIDLAVENGRSAPELSSSEQKTADLANLELLVSRVAGQTSAGGEGSGNLKQIQDFNAFLERAAAALEAR